VPAEYAAFDLHGWRGELPPAVITFLAEPAAQRSIYVHGSPGRGKTHLTTAIFRRLITEGLSGQWRDCPTLVQAARGMLRRGADEEYDAEVFRLQTADVLLLDDLGSELDSEFSRDYLGTLIRSRHAEQRIVIVNSNRSLAALVAPKDDGGLGRDPAIGSRLRGLAVEVGGSDQRTRRH
jgi:DNA replication protein DnaC